MRERYETFTSLIVNINRYIVKIKNYEMNELGLKGNQVQCLHYLYNVQAGLTSKQLEELCEEDKAAISRTLKRLEELGLVSTDKDSGQKYRTRYSLTAKGQNYGKTITLKINEVMDAASAGIDENERARLYSSLNTICGNLKKIYNS